MSDLRLSVSNRRLEFTRMRLKVKLFSNLKEQMMYLKKWARLDKDYVGSLLDSTEFFRASTVQLPFVCGATANALNLKAAICSAVDVLQAMASSICSLMSEVEKMNSLLKEVVRVATSEHALLDECKDFISDLAALQVSDCSLRAHISQTKRIPPLKMPTELKHERKVTLLLLFKQELQTYICQVGEEKTSSKHIMTFNKRKT